MARGIANGEPVVSQAQSKAFDAGYDRIQRTERASERGRFIYDPEIGRCVRADQYQGRPEARSAPFMVDRYMEGASSVDGVDIGSRQKRRRFMRERGVADAGDFGPDYSERVKHSDELAAEKQIRAAAEQHVERAVLMRQRDYDRQVAQRRAQRLERDRRVDRELGE